MWTAIVTLLGSALSAVGSVFGFVKAKQDELNTPTMIANKENVNEAKEIDKDRETVDAAIKSGDLTDLRERNS